MKLLRIKITHKLGSELLQINASFTALSRETRMLTGGKNFILRMLQLIGKVSVLQDGLTQIQFDI